MATHPASTTAGGDRSPSTPPPVRLSGAQAVAAIQPNSPRPNARVYAAAAAASDGDVGSGKARRKRLAVFVSGGGSNFRSIHEAALGGRVNGDVVALVTDKPGCGGAEHARGNGIPVVVFPKSKSAPEGVSPAELLNVLRDLKVDFILLAGYLKHIPVELVQAYPRSILNIHPSLLPAFGGKGYYGFKVHKAVIASGARYSGPTVHFVDEHYDTGRTLVQRVVPVLANDTPEQLAARVLDEVPGMESQEDAWLVSKHTWQAKQAVQQFPSAFPGREHTHLELLLGIKHCDMEDQESPIQF